jgi:uncharacterized membrane protein YqaE (UPF0057 family)
MASDAKADAVSGIILQLLLSARSGRAATLLTVLLSVLSPPLALRTGLQLQHFWLLLLLSVLLLPLLELNATCLSVAGESAAAAAGRAALAVAGRDAAAVAGYNCCLFS